MTSPIPATFTSINPALLIPCPAPDCAPIPGKDQFHPAGKSPADQASEEIFVPG